MKLLLIRPGFSIFERERLSIAPPLGLAYIAAVMESEGHKVEILDGIAFNWKNSISTEKNGESLKYYGPTDEGLMEVIRKSAPELVGISCLASMYAQEAHHVAHIVKLADKDIKVVFGGVHPSALPRETLKDPNVDYVVIGEGEKAATDLANRLEEGQDVSSIDGFAFKSNNGVIVNPKTKFIEDLDTIPFPARHLLPMEEYFKASKSVASHGGPTGLRATSMVTSRGCPGRCVFCSTHSIWGYKWRARTPHNVVDEIEFLVGKYKIQSIYFEDDNLTLDRKRVEKICDEIMNRNIKITWDCPNGVAVNTLTPDLIRKMKNAGCRGLAFGIEHGDPEMRRKVVCKPIETGHVKKIVNSCRQVGIQTTGFFIIGLPSETEETYKQTVEFAKETNFDVASFFIALPLPGSNLFEYAVKKYNITDLDDFSSSMRMYGPTIPVLTDSFSSEDLIKLQKEAYKKFFYHKIKSELKPQAIFNRIKRYKSMENLKSDVSLLKRFSQILK